MYIPGFILDAYLYDTSVLWDNFLRDPPPTVTYWYCGIIFDMVITMATQWYYRVTDVMTDHSYGIPYDLNQYYYMIISAVSWNTNVIRNIAYE